MIDYKQITIQTIGAHWLQSHEVLLDVLRLDKLHPVVSGNKWFKLQYYLQEAINTGFDTIATFGGAYSNHIVAAAFACKELGLKSIGIIRGEQPPTLSHTLVQAQAFGMQLQFVSREHYKHKEAAQARFENVYWIPEGGYGNLGAAGAAQIAQLVSDFASYTHLACATGTGTTVAGLIKAALPHQTTIGISVLKNNMSITGEINSLLSFSEQQKAYSILHDYHFGGYAKYTPALLQHMNEWWKEHQLPTDFVYTAKTFFAIQQLILNQTIPAGSRVLFIHTGGLQGNLSLPQGVLSFS